ncbi:MAG: hypothetical protein JWR24_3702 [Actinoallomurus sp.]|nr:hypothetical protein [Actinoallomurus sp.]
MALRWRVRAKVASLAVPVMVAAGCTANGVPVDGPPDSHPGRATGKGNEATARKELAKLKTGTPGSMTGYTRDQFGPAWKDVDDNGCDTRDDILARDLDKVQKRGTCVVVAGDLHDPYTGKAIIFAKAHAFQVQIDHVFPLGLAWKMGADHWSEDKRTELANDRGNLLAVWSRPNEQKSDKGPAEWQPRKDFQCTYAEKLIAVAHEYDLSVTRADHSELETMLRTC